MLPGQGELNQLVHRRGQGAESLVNNLWWVVGGSVDFKGDSNKYGVLRLSEPSG
jgi:hypothetical protein